MTDKYLTSAILLELKSAITSLKGDNRRLLILGGSGFISGRLLEFAKATGFQVWIVTRGKKPVPNGVILLKADRDHPEEFSKVINKAEVVWDVVIDCIGMKPRHARQDIELFEKKTQHLIFISTDSVYDPAKREYPQPTDPAVYVNDGYGFDKRSCEKILIEASSKKMQWTIVRPCHVYGPRAHLGCLPSAFRDPLLIQKIKDREAISLVGGGHFLHHPIFIDDLALLILSLANHSGAYGKVFNTPGGKIDTMKSYYEAIAAILNCELRIKEISVDKYLLEHPERANAVCHRIYDMTPLENVGAILPSTDLMDGLKKTLKNSEFKN